MSGAEQVEMEERLAEAIRGLLRQLYVGGQYTSVEAEWLKLSVLERQVLGVLLNQPGMMIKELAIYFGVQGTTMKSVLDRLIAGNLVHKAPHAIDKRAVALSLTQKGADIIGSIRSQDLKNCRDMLKQLSSKRQEQFVDDLERMLKRFSK
ncbi:MAG: MarR family transcriptional regulator [Pseudomonadota bacterium]